MSITTQQNVNNNFEEIVDTSVVKEESVTTIMCSNCNIILELTDDILHEMILSNSQRFDKLMLNKVKEHFDALKRESRTKGIQCEIIGKTSVSKEAEVPK